MLSTFFKSLKRDTAGKRYLPFVDGIRFLAIMPVVILHANERLQRYVTNTDQMMSWENEMSYLISRGAIGVMIFFALSGFILSLPFAKQASAFSYKTYLKRRLTRLEPPFIFWMTVFGLVLFFKSNIELSELAKHYFASLFYVHNISYGEFSIINPVAWSLEVEIQYYLIAPFIALFYFRLEDKKSRRALLLSLTTIFVIYQHLFGWQYLPVKASILGQFQHFMMGMLMADVYINEPNWHKIKTYKFDLIGLLSVITMMFTWTEDLAKSIVFMVALIGFLAGCLKGKLFNQLLTLQWVTIIGGMCYTIYLTHLPLLELIYSVIGKFGYSSPYWLQLSISLIVALPIILFSSMIFYKYIEQPFMSQNALSRITRLITARLKFFKGHYSLKAEQK